MSPRTGLQPVKRTRSAFAREQHRWGYIFIAPAIIGLIVLTAYPIIFSFIVGLSEWDIITPMNFVGLRNYIQMFTKDELIGKSLIVTVKYTLMSVPLSNAVALIMALLLNTSVKGRSVFRTVFYIPSILPVVASAALWMYLYNPMYGEIGRAHV